MLTRVVDELEQKTILYWELSRIRNGKSTRKISTSQALHHLSDLIFENNPARPLVHMARQLQHEIIVDTPRAQPQVTKTIYLRK